jgi:hypothetical protein
MNMLDEKPGQIFAVAMAIELWIIVGSDGVFRPDQVLF